MTGDAAGALPARFDPRLAAIVWVLGGALSWALISIAVHHLHGRLPPTDLSFYRSISGVLLMLPIIWPHRRAIAIAGFGRRTVLLYALRGVMVFSGQAAFYFALAYVPVAEATVLNCTVPIFVAILAVIFLRERVSPFGWTMIALGFAGILLILRPGIAIIHYAAPFALLAALLFASSGILNKVLGRTEPASRIVFFTNVLVLACGSIPFVFISRTPAWADVPPVVVVCIFGTVAQYCIARAFALADASFVGPLDIMRVPFAALAGWIVFAEFPDLWVWIGTVVVFVSILMLTRGHVRGQPPAAEPLA